MYGVQCAEEYYRAMVSGGADSWNVRDSHMAEALERLLRCHGPDSKAIVWEHNTHIGDARFTDMAGAGMVNVGQLVRERIGPEEVVLVGFGSHRGSVIAAPCWGAPMEAMQVPPAREGSWEDALHRAGEDDKPSIAPTKKTGSTVHAGTVRSTSSTTRPTNATATTSPRYYPAATTPSCTSTRALHPLHMKPRESGEPPETFPFGE